MRVLRPGTHGFGKPYTPSPHDSGMLMEDVYPTLYFGIERTDEVRRKMHALDWAAAALGCYDDEVPELIREAPRLEPGVTSWRHSFYSPETGGPLLFDPDSQNGISDPITGKTWDGEEIRGAWRQLAHERIYRMMRSAAFLYRVKGTVACARWAADALAGAAEVYTHDEIRNPKYSYALYNQPLYDSQILALIAITFRLIEPYLVENRPELIDATNRTLLGGVPYLTEQLDTGAIHNTSAHIALAVALIGEALGDDELVERGIMDPATGVDAHLKTGLFSPNGVSDGFWFEGTLFYHLYTMCPLIELCELARRRGFHSEWRYDCLRSMFDAVFKLADDRMRLYCLGDFGAPEVTSLIAYHHLLEYGHGILEHGDCGKALSRIYASGPGRYGLAALCYGADHIDNPEPPEEQATMRASVEVLENTGIARLSSPEGFDVWFKSGKYAGGHDHLDCLAFGIHAAGEIISTDLGCPGYGLSDIRPFYKSTISHNTLLVDEIPQNRVTRASLEVIDGTFPAVSGIAGDLHPDVEIERSVRLEPPYVVVSDECRSKNDHRYSWIFHALGSLSASITRRCKPVAIQPLPQSDTLFGRFVNRETDWTDETFCADYRVRPNLWLRVLVSSDGPLECSTGRTPGNPITDSRGTILLRRRGRSCRFTATFEIHNGRPRNPPRIIRPAQA